MIHYRRLVPRLAALIGVLLFARLGFWQLERAQEARTLERTAAAHLRAPRLTLDGTALEGDRRELHWRPVEAHGTWETSRQILLDNQVSRGVAGYYVYTPLRLDGCDCAVLVNRGWVPVGPDRRNIPDIGLAAAATSVHGIAAPPPASGIGVRHETGERLTAGVLRVQRLAGAEIPQWLGMRVLPLTVLLDAAEPHGFRRAWRPPAERADRHVAYAGQWFLFALIAAGLAIFRLNSGRA